MNEYSLKENVERLTAAFGYMMSSYFDDETNIHPKFDNLNDIATILDGIFEGTTCKEVIFTQNLDNGFFGIRVNPTITKDTIITIISTSDIVNFKNYSLEIDSKILDAQLTPEEIAVYVLYEISSMIASNEVIDKLRSYIDVYLTSADDVISLRDTVHYYQLIIYAIKDTLTKLSSMVYKDTPEDLLNSNNLINSLELNDTLIDAHQKIISSENGPGDSVRTPNLVLLRWMFIMYRSMDTNSNVVKDSLKDAYSLTGSKLDKFEIEKTLHAIDHIDNTVAYIKEDGDLISFLESANIKIVNESLFGGLKRRGLRSLEDDLYTAAMTIKNLEDENEALYAMRYINTRLNILEDYLYENQDISDNEKRHWQIVANKYRALREELVRKKIWNRKQYGLFWDYNQQFEGDPTDESTETVEEAAFFDNLVKTLKKMTDTTNESSDLSAGEELDEGFFRNSQLLAGVQENLLEDISKSSTDLAAVKSEWKKVADKFVTHKWIYRYIKDEKQKELLEKHYKNLTDDDVSYGDYKKSFAYIAQFFGLPKNEIIIEWLEFEEAKNNEPERIALRYSKGLYKVSLPPDVRLIHIAPVNNITNLEPAFRSKTKGKFMYPSKRCFFTVGKTVNPFKAGLVTSKNPIKNLKQRAELKSYKYTTKADKVPEVYIDPTYNQINDSSVMIITEKPIPVMKFEDKMHQIFKAIKDKFTGKKKEDTVKESSDDDVLKALDIDYEREMEKAEKNAPDYVATSEEAEENGESEDLFDAMGDLDAFMESADIKEYDFRQFMQYCTKNFPEQYRKGMSRFEEDEEEELDDFLQGYSKTLAVGYFNCRAISRDSNIIHNEIIPAIRKFCKQATEESKLFKIYISDSDGLDIFLDIKRKEVTNEATWYDAEARDILESFDIDYELIDEGAIKDFIETIKNWKTSNLVHARRVFKSNSITDEEYEELTEVFKTLKDPEVKFRDYSKAFKTLCTYCHTIPAGTIITKYVLKKGSEDHNILEVRYSENTKKMKLPEGVKLYHMSKVPGIKELIPQFKGKAEKGFLYDRPRIYFTINKYMPHFLADYRKGEKVYKYEAQQEISDVYVDPLVWTISQGAVYVETNSPIPVKEVKDNIVKDAINKITPTKKEEENNEDDKQKIGEEEV